jgi:hypothetical protein
MDLTVTADHEATMARMATGRMATAPMVIGKDMEITGTTAIAKKLSITSRKPGRHHADPIFAE